MHGSGEQLMGVDLHLRVVGGILENHRMYAGARDNAVKDLVIGAIRAIGTETVTYDQIRDTLCYETLPLVAGPVLKQALKSLEHDEKLECINPRDRTYRLCVDVPLAATTLTTLVSDAWQRHFRLVPAALFEHFQQALAILFARYGCAAYDVLSKGSATTARFSEVLAALSLPENQREDFSDGFEDFVLSAEPDDVRLKLGLASAYAFIRMNGAGNWDLEDIRRQFAGRRILLDTNVLFEFAGRNITQASRVVQLITNLGARFVIGHETRHEFENALRTAADQVVYTVCKGVDLKRIAEAGLLRSDWVRSLLEDNASPTRDQVFERVERLLGQVDSIIAAENIERIPLLRETEGERRDARIAKIQEGAMSSRGWEKPPQVALHDALLWEAIEEDPKLADTILTMDRSLARIRVGGSRAAMMFDEIVAYALLGGANEPELAALFSTTLTHDLFPHSAFFSMEDVQTIARLESRLLDGSPRALRKAAKKLSALRNERLRSGHPMADHDIGHVLVQIMLDEEDERIEQRSDDVARRADARRAALEKELQDSKDAHAREAADLTGKLVAARDGHAILKAEDAARQRQHEKERKERTEAEEQAKDRKDWMLFSALVLAVGCGLFTLGAVVTGCSLVVIALAIVLWGAVAHNVPKPSFRTLLVILSVVAALGGLAEKLKWVQGRGSPQPERTSSAVEKVL